MIYTILKNSSFFKQLVFNSFTIISTQTKFIGAKVKFFWLYYQDVVPLYPEVTEKIDMIK